VLSNERKEAGNRAFARKDYNTALINYTEAIAHRKDNKLLYTNRALTNLFLCNFTSALKDCNTAMEIFEFLEVSTRRLTCTNALRLSRTSIDKL
jgi:tetratricopeptide (TPR) repeat protein